MGAAAARKAAQVVINSSRVIAIELICAAQAIDLLDQRELGAGTGRIYRQIRQRVLKLTEDRPLSDDIEVISRLVISGGLQE